MLGGSGHDILIGGKGGDVLGPLIVRKGGAGNDTLRGGPGVDILVGAKGADVLRGGGNKAKKGDKEDLLPGPGTDVVYGGPGDDNVSLPADGSRDVVRCGSGNDVINYTGAGRDPRDVVISCETVRTS